MKKLLFFGIIGCLIIGNQTYCTTNTTPNWLTSKINNTTNNVQAQVTINYTPDCSKITLKKEKDECLAQGYSLTLKLEPKKTLSPAEFIGVIDSDKQCPAKDGSYKNSIQISFPTEEPGTKTYSPLEAITIAKEDLQKQKNYSIKLLSGKMSIK